MSRSPRLRAAFIPPGPLLGGDSGRPPATPLSQVLALTGHWSGEPGLPSLPAADHETTHPPLHPAQLPPQAQLATLPLPPRRSSGLPGGSVWEGGWSPKLPLTEPAGGPRTRVHWGPGRVCTGVPDACAGGPGATYVPVHGGKERVPLDLLHAVAAGACGGDKAASERQAPSLRELWTR